MNRDLVLATLVVALCGSAIWLAGWLPARWGGRAEESGRVAERRTWLALWLPLVPAAAALAALAGWAMQEPRLTDEILRPVTPLFVAPIAAIWLRAAWRAGRALAHPRVPPLAATLGLLRPRIAIDERLSRDLDATAGQAVLAHERAHCRHRDPLRIWLAQIASDLQWPSRAPPPASSAGGKRWSSPAMKRRATAASMVKISRPRCSAPFAWHSGLSSRRQRPSSTASRRWSCGSVGCSRRCARHPRNRGAPASRSPGRWRSWPRRQSSVSGTAICSCARCRSSAG